MKNRGISEVIAAMRRIGVILEPSGCAVDYGSSSPEDVREFLRALANTVWLLGIASECILLEVPVPERAAI